MQIQAVSDAGNLVFVIFLLAIVILTAVIAYRKLRRRPSRQLVRAIVACLCAYMMILIAVSLSSQTRKLAPGTDKCFDDWCASVIGVRSLPHTRIAGMKVVAIAIRVANRARRAAFRPSQPRVTLVLTSGESISPSNSAQREFQRQSGPQENLAKRLVAGDSFQTMLVFEVPDTTREASVVILEGPALITRFLVGDENSFFHRKMVYTIMAD